MTDEAPWVTFRPGIKVLDCTIRDGGLINDHLFEDDFVRAVYRACIDAGIDYMADLGPFRKGERQSLDQSKLTGTRGRIRHVKQSSP